MHHSLFLTSFLVCTKSVRLHEANSHYYHWCSANTYFDSNTICCFTECRLSTRVSAHSSFTITIPNRDAWLDSVFALSLLFLFNLSFLFVFRFPCTDALYVCHWQTLHRESQKRNVFKICINVRNLFKIS